MPGDGRTEIFTSVTASALFYYLPSMAVHCLVSYIRVTQDTYMDVSGRTTH